LDKVRQRRNGLGKAAPGLKLLGGKVKKKVKGKKGLLQTPNYESNT